MREGVGVDVILRNWNLSCNWTTTWYVYIHVIGTHTNVHNIFMIPIPSYTHIHIVYKTVWRTVKWHCTGKMCQVHVLLEKTTCPYILFAPQILFYIDLFQVNHCRLKSVWQIFNSCSRHALHLYILSPKSSKSDHFYYWNMLKPMVTWESTILRKPHIFRFRIMDLFSLPRGSACHWSFTSSPSSVGRKFKIRLPTVATLLVS